MRIFVHFSFKNRVPLVLDFWGQCYVTRWSHTCYWNCLKNPSTNLPVSLKKNSKRRIAWCLDWLSSAIGRRVIAEN